MGDFVFWAPKSLWMVTAVTKLKDACSLEEKLQQHIKKQRHHFDDKGPYSQSYGFCLVMYRCESQLIKKAESEELMLLKKTLESSLDSKEIKPVNPKGNQP